MSAGTAPAKLADTVTYLEMTAKPARPPVPVPAAKLALMRTERCTVSFYRYLYNIVGEPWLWYERRLWSDARVAELLARPDVEIYVLYAWGVPAGYFELVRAARGDTELAYFGLVPEFIGRGFGAWFLNAAIETAWLGASGRVWVHTCTFDHPRALGLYQRSGFKVYERRAVTFDDPRVTGVFPRSLKHPLLPPLD
ncbi:MAG TPA: GNAT family N-acetyltransferase [Stellaceae bacterium]|nr:GNAT family N-acetyltransferase [Stellaceae bacterium]